MANDFNIDEMTMLFAAHQGAVKYANECGDKLKNHAPPELPRFFADQEKYDLYRAHLSDYNKKYKDLHNIFIIAKNAVVTATDALCKYIPFKAVWFRLSDDMGFPGQYIAHTSNNTCDQIGINLHHYKTGNPESLPKLTSL